LRFESRLKPDYVTLADYMRVILLEHFSEMPTMRTGGFGDGLSRLQRH